MVFFGGQFLKEFDMGRSWVGGKVGMELKYLVELGRTWGEPKWRENIPKRSMLLRQVLERSGQGSAGGSRYIKIWEGSWIWKVPNAADKRIAR